MSYQKIIERYKQLYKQELLRNTGGTFSGPPAARTISFLLDLDTMVALNDMDDKSESMMRLVAVVGKTS